MNDTDLTLEAKQDLINNLYDECKNIADKYQLQNNETPLTAAEIFDCISFFTMDSEETLNSSSTIYVNTQSSIVDILKQLNIINSQNEPSAMLITDSNSTTTALPLRVYSFSLHKLTSVTGNTIYKHITNRNLIVIPREEIRTTNFTTHES